MNNPLYFNGFGLITAIGDTVDETLAAASKGPSEPPLVTIEQAEGDITIPYFSIKNPPISAGVERIYTIIDKVIQQAVSEAGLSDLALQQAGLFVGSTSFDMFRCETALKVSGASDDEIEQQIPSFNRLTDYIQTRFDMNGPVYTFNTACTSSANALIYAAEFIRRGDIRHALVLGLEFYNEVTALGFSSLELISKHSMRPFDQHRDGLYLGEGCGATIISATPQLGNFSFITGANIGDNFSLTASNPDGIAIKKVIETALTQAGLDRNSIAVVKTHGTASLSNDEAESAGLKGAFGDAIPPIVALKPLLGHTLGACGINELIVFIASLKNRSVVSFPSVIAKDYPLRLARDQDIPAQGNYLLNYFGFGGNSTALVISNA